MIKVIGTYMEVYERRYALYDYNRISVVLQDTAPLTKSESMDNPDANKFIAFRYNEWEFPIKYWSCVIIADLGTVATTG